MPVPGRHKVVAVLRKGNGLDFGRDLVGGHLDVVVPVPHVDNHVLLGPHRDDVLAVGGKGHHIDAIFMPGKFRDLMLLRHVPDPDAGGVAALARDHVAAVLRKGHGGDGFSGSIDDVALTIFPGVIEHNRASGRVGHDAARGR